MKRQVNLMVFAFFTTLMTTFYGCEKDPKVPKPPEMAALATNTVSGITTTSASSGGNVTSIGGAAVTARGVCWSTSQEPTVADSKTTDGTGSGTFSSNLEGLTSSTTYYVRAYATNSVGTAYGNEISFTTNLAGLATLTTTAVTGISAGYAVSGGNITSDGGVNITDMGLCWGTTVNPTTNDKKVSYGPGISDFIFGISGLQPSTKYYVRSYATNSLGTSYGNELDFTTLPIGLIIFNPDLPYGSVSDIDGNIYKTIQIGTQLWMAENLKTTNFNDGTLIPNVTDNIEWENLTTPGYCWYNNDAASYKTTYGALYNWYAVRTNKICPTGWHVPADSEFNTLAGYLGNDSGKITETGNTHWLTYNTGVTNESGFTALPGGGRQEESDVSTDIKFGGIEFFSGWWLATGDESFGSAFTIWGDEDMYLTQVSKNKFDGWSVRCLKDN